MAKYSQTAWNLRNPKLLLLDLKKKNPQWRELKKIQLSAWKLHEFCSAFMVKQKPGSRDCFSC